jgi:hypothetical protein
MTNKRSKTSNIRCLEACDNACRRANCMLFMCYDLFRCVIFAVTCGDDRRSCFNVERTRTTVFDTLRSCQTCHNMTPGTETLGSIGCCIAEIKQLSLLRCNLTGNCVLNVNMSRRDTMPKNAQKRACFGRFGRTCSN